MALDSSTVRISFNPGEAERGGAARHPRAHRRVEDLGVALEDVGDTHGHRAVDEDEQVRDAVLGEQFRQVPEDLLRALEREARHDDVAAAPPGLGDHRGEALLDLHARVVDPIAVGRLDDDPVGVRRRLRIVEQRLVPAADVPGEEQPPPVRAEPPVDEDRGRAEDVAGVAEARREAAAERDLVAIGGRREERERRLHVLRRVERHLGVRTGAPLALVALPLEGRVLDLEFGGIGEHDRGDLRRDGRRHDPSAEAVAHQPRQVAAVVDVGVREQHRVDGGGGDGEGLPVAGQELPLLVEPAVDEHARAPVLEQVARAGDVVGGAEEGQPGRGPGLAPFSATLHGTSVR